ncbi:MAG: GAF domain-containing sensor histidine kinase [Bacteroidota bacterium]
MNVAPPIPSNEMDRLLKLSEFDIDYADVQDSLKDLTKLAAKVAGTSVSLVNLIDVFTQWTISNFGLDVEQTPREDTVCQYTITAKESFEVKNLTADDRFADKSYVVGEPKLTYYFGVPLQTSDGYNIGALCVMDKIGKEISPEKAELLKIIADEIVNRLLSYQALRQMRSSVKEAKDNQRKVAHDIRGPLGGIVSLAQIIAEQGKNNQMDQVLQFIQLIQKSGNSLLDLANEILSGNKQPVAGNGQPAMDDFNLLVFKDKLEKLFRPQAIPKNINFSVNILGVNENVSIAKNKLMQITGNLISNAIKFTPIDGTITVELDLSVEKDKKQLLIRVQDSGTGMDKESVDRILQGTSDSRDGTSGEKGYGFGLSLVKHLIDDLQGTLSIESEAGKGSVFEVRLALK